MRVRRAAYRALPDVVQPLARHGYLLVWPGLSWRKWTRTLDRFVDRFFDSRAEFDGYVEEFWDGRITDVVLGAAEEAPDHVEVFDAHKFVSERLYALVRKLEPDILVETGVYHGVSTASLLVALERNGTGRLYSVDDSGSVGTCTRTDCGECACRGRHLVRERPSCAEWGSHVLPPGEEPGWILPDDLRDRWELRTGRPQRELPSLLSELGGVDLFLHDSGHSRTGMAFEFDAAWEWLRPGGVVVSHHVDWNDAFETFVEERDAEHGRMTYTYFGKYRTPGCSAYAVKH